MQDTVIICENCQQEFVFTVGEQEFYAQKGLSQPRLCLICRAKKRAEEQDRAKYSK